MIKLTQAENELYDKLIRESEATYGSSIEAVTMIERQHAIQKTLQIIVPDMNKVYLDKVIADTIEIEAMINASASTTCTYYAMLAKTMHKGRRSFVDELCKYAGIKLDDGKCTMNVSYELFKSIESFFYLNKLNF